MSNEMIVAVGVLRDFIHKAHAEWPDMPLVTLTFATNEQRERFRAQMRADMTTKELMEFTDSNRSLGLGIDAEIEGVKIALRVKQ